MMTWLGRIFVGFVLSLLLIAGAAGQDMRVVQQLVYDQRAQLEAQAAAEKQAAQNERRERLTDISQDRTALNRELDSMQIQVKQLRQQVNGLTGTINDLQKQDQEVANRLAKTDALLRETVGVVRLNAKDLLTLLDDDPQSGLREAHTELLEGIVEQARFPAMDDIRMMTDLLFAQLQSSGEVELRKSEIIDRSGFKREARVLTLGPFPPLYQLDGEVGFLDYSAVDNSLTALSRQPGGRQQRQIKAYLLGESDMVPIDVSRGGALRQLAHRLSLWQQVERGGVLVWPIMAILVVGSLIIIERAVFLLRKRVNGDHLLADIERLAEREDWSACQQVCSAAGQKPVARVLQAGLKSHSRSRAELEDLLQEAILREIPPMERFLAALGMLAAIAPLLGLLGTVTGMIDTFQVMTQFGTGDPRLMSGGISVALVTTMLGLMVAIPIMLAHTLLARAVENAIAQLEEKAVALVNIMQKSS